MSIKKSSASFRHLCLFCYRFLVFLVSLVLLRKRRPFFGMEKLGPNSLSLTSLPPSPAPSLLNNLPNPFSITFFIPNSLHHSAYLDSHSPLHLVSRPYPFSASIPPCPAPSPPSYRLRQEVFYDAKRFSAAFQLMTSQMAVKYSALRFSYCRLEGK